jgi:hypothetical protein
MEQQPNTSTRSQPQDRSVEAYKAWILGIAQRLTTGTDSMNLTDLEWKQHWKEYWNSKLPVRNSRQSL